MTDRPDPGVDLLLELYSSCRSFNSLPRSGGILDQDYDHIVAFNLIEHFQHKRQEQQRKLRGRNN